MALTKIDVSALKKTGSLDTKLIKGSGNDFAPATAGTEFAPATSGSSVLKGNGAGGFANAVAGTDILTPAQIGASVQAYDADTAKTDVAQTFTASQKTSIVAENDMTVDLSATGNDYSITPTGGGTLTFNNIAGNAGKSGNIVFVNGSNYAIAKGANILCPSSLFSTISTTGDFWMSYHCNGTSVRLAVSGPNV